MINQTIDISQELNTDFSPTLGQEVKNEHFIGEIFEWIGKFFFNPENQKGDINISTFYLDNKIPVICFEDPYEDLEKIDFNAIIAHGSKDDFQGKRGLAHITEHMVASEPEGEDAAKFLRKMIQYTNSSYNAETSYSTTEYKGNVNEENFADYAKLIGKSIAHPKFDQKSFENEKKSVKIEEAIGKNSLTTENVIYSIFHNKESLLDEQMDNIEIADVIKFWKDFYRSDRMAIITRSQDIPHEKIYSALKNSDFNTIPKSDHDNNEPDNKSVKEIKNENEEKIIIYNLPHQIYKNTLMVGFEKEKFESPSESIKSIPLSCITLTQPFLSSELMLEIRLNEGLIYSCSAYTSISEEERVNGIYFFADTLPEDIIKLVDCALKNIKNFGDKISDERIEESIAATKFLIKNEKLGFYDKETYYFKKIYDGICEKICAKENFDLDELINNILFKPINGSFSYPLSVYKENIDQLTVKSIREYINKITSKIPTILITGNIDDNTAQSYREQIEAIVNKYYGTEESEDAKKLINDNLIQAA